MKKKLALVISTFFFIGYFPKTPGTFGSLAGLLLMIGVGFFFPQYSGAFNFMLALVAFVCGCWATEVVIREHFSSHDPGEIVIDEVVGVAATFAFVPFNASLQSVALYGVGFVLFRYFDIAKPWLIGRIDRSHGRFSVMLDDVVAGFFAWCIVFLLHSTLF